MNQELITFITINLIVYSHNTIAINETLKIYKLHFQPGYVHSLLNIVHESKIFVQANQYNSKYNKCVADHQQSILQEHIQHDPQALFADKNLTHKEY